MTNIGEIGTGTMGTPVPVPTRVAAPTGVRWRLIRPSESTSTCAVTTTDEVLCWGGNSSRELGDGTTQIRLTPSRVHGR